MFSLEQLDYKNENVNVSESYGMQLVCSTVLQICNAIDILILKRDSLKKRTESNMEVKDIKHQDKTGVGSEALKYSQPLDVEPEIGFNFFLAFFSFLTCKMTESIMINIY